MGLRTTKGTDRIKAQIAALPRTIAQTVAARGAPVLTSLTQQAFGSGSTVYGEARPQGVHGNRLDLNETGATAAELHFTSTGTRIRAVLTRNYQRFLVGKYSILPNGAMPASFRAKLGEIVHQVKPT